MTCATRIFFLVNIVFCILGLAIMALGIWCALVVQNTTSWIGWVLAGCGLLLILVVNLGCAGSGYKPKRKERRKLVFLLMYFFFMLTIMLGVILLALLCVVSHDYIEAIILGNYNYYMQAFKATLPGADLQQMVDYVFTNTITMGVIGGVSGLFLLVGVMLAAKFLGARHVVRATLIYGNIIVIVMGCGAAALGGYLSTLFSLMNTLPIVLLAAGAAVALLAVLGIIAAARVVRCLLAFFSIFALLLALGFLALGIIAFALENDVDAIVTQACTDAPAMCSGLVPSSSDPAVVVEVIKNFTKSHLRVFALVALFVGAFLTYIFAASLSFIRLGRTPDKAAHSGRRRTPVPLKPGTPHRKVMVSEDQPGASGSAMPAPPPPPPPPVHVAGGYAGDPYGTALPYSAEMVDYANAYDQQYATVTTAYYPRDAGAYPQYVTTAPGGPPSQFSSAYPAPPPGPHYAATQY
eukprot:gnl/Trimastix_PCT/1192.p1 GENE.gnl/Trimastix_PCT/1192~~gnl/Trimastix_PCT/1192.p1  ORF type:complete len:465 (+),score=82.61 gnl/Trimastix_PCT/1192:111-1505(+)